MVEGMAWELQRKEARQDVPRAARGELARHSFDIGYLTYQGLMCLVRRCGRRVAAQSLVAYAHRGT